MLLIYCFNSSSLSYCLSEQTITKMNPHPNMYCPRYPRLPNTCYPQPQFYSRSSFQGNHGFRPMGIPHYQHRPSFCQNNNFQRTEHWCETCDRGFPTVVLLEQHNQQHQKCNIDGCQFIAHPKVITKHIQMQHSTGLFKKIANINNPEDIRKWREERKKMYPTKENVEKKEAEIKEKIERGEKMGLKKNKNKFYVKKKGEPQKRKYPSNDANSVTKRKKQNEYNIKKKRPPLQEKDLPNPDDKRTLKPFAGIQNLFTESDTESQNEPEQNCNYFSEDEDFLSETSNKTNTVLDSEKPVVCGALSSLIYEYASSDEDPEEMRKNNKLEKITDSKGKNPSDTKNQEKMPFTSQVTDNSNQKLGACSYKATKQQISDDDDDDNSGPEEVKVEKQPHANANSSKSNDSLEDPTKTDKISMSKNKPKVKSRRPVQRIIKPKVPSTLIYKLLHREIQQERNILLQCVRHIVKNNYFDRKIV